MLTSATSANFCELVRQRLRSWGDEPFIEFAGTWYSGAEVAAYASQLDELLARAHVPSNASLAVVVRNRVPHAGVILGLVGSGRSFSLMHAFQSPESLATDAERLRPAVLVADQEDWTPPVVAAAARVGSVGIAISLTDRRVAYADGLEQLGEGPFAEVSAEPSVHVLTSGTTGPPKRIAIKMPVLERAAQSASIGQSGRHGPPNLVFWPFGGIGGVCSLTAAPYVGRPFVLLEKFNVPDFVSAIRRHRMTTVGVPPAVIRMVLAANVPPADLSSLEYVMGGSGPLDAETKQRFEKTYGIPVLWSYGATEFAGGVLFWTPELYREWGATKRASSGRPIPGTQVRVVDPSSGAEVPVGKQGVLEAKVDVIGPDWIRTNDLASVDEDGFVTLHGRADGAINRGGFKVVPEVVQQALADHPGVLEASVVGVPDPLLGEVPVAVVEPVEGVPRPTAAQLERFLRDRLPAYQIPTKFLVLDRLPRTSSLKVSLADVRALADRS